MQKSQSLRLGGERRRLSGGVFHQRLHADPVRPGDVRAATLGRHEDARGAAGTDGGAMFPVISPIMESLSTSAMGAIRISAFRAAQHTAFSPVAPR